MSDNAKIMVVDDEPSMLRYLRTLLEVDGYSTLVAPSGVEAIRRIEQGARPDLILLDVVMPELDGLQTLERLQQIAPAIKVVMLSCVSDTAKVVQSMRLGAQDYLTKPFRKEELDALLQRILPNADHAPVSSYVEELGADLFFLSASPAMNKIHAQVKLLAKVDVPVLVIGESGTGKEIVARLIHKNSQRAHRSFLKVNCAALPADLLESELFGYDAGAFTGAERSKPGKFEICNNGTLLLDELGEMPTSLQAKLLHVLQDGQFSRLGSRTTTQVDVRVLAATNIDVQKGIADRSFREDLYYRLNTFMLEIPPLRDRREEIPLLLKQFMRRMSGSYARDPLPISPSLVQACQRAEWAGNVRELASFVKRYLILGDEGLAISELQRGTYRVSDDSGTTGDLKALLRDLKGEAEIDAIQQALDQAAWNRKGAAKLLNISYKALLYKIRQYDIKPAGRKSSAIGSRLQ